MNRATRDTLKRANISPLTHNTEERKGYLFICGYYKAVQFPYCPLKKCQSHEDESFGEEEAVGDSKAGCGPSEEKEGDRGTLVPKL